MSDENTQQTPEGPFDGFMAPDGAFKENWADSLPETLRDAGATLKNFKSFPEVVGELHRLSRAQEGSLRVPKEGDDPATVSAWLKAVGAEEKPEGYGLEEGQKAIAEWAHANRVPKSALKPLLELQKAQQEAAAAKAKEAEQAEVAAAQDAIKKLWGEKNVPVYREKAMKLANHFKVNLDEYADPNLANMVFEFSKWCEEDPNMSSGKGIPNSLFSMVAPNAYSQGVDIVENPGNPDHKRYWEGDPSVIKKVVALMSRGQ